jgi:hypothetical protein
MKRVILISAIIGAVIYLSSCTSYNSCKGIKAHPDYKRNGAKNW